MYTQEEYLYGWLMYAGGALLLIVCGWVLTARIPWNSLRQIIRALGITTLCVPWYADADKQYLAPAWIIAAFEGLFDKNFWRAGGPLLSALAVAFAMAVLILVIARFSGRGKAEQADNE
ncbi:hypothetical protein DWB84_03280 [Saccharophagus sp. K07]|jgi:hypothetical protein|uniref:hypothetical protein n=1 Tax=Saccharophagus sp. K07 TaxID=2283636 RepID=UPI001652675E|nr:hypothetical protein [Saccharophagus sp. K07]MBC6904488.1 hypothetical protein [Saccharophagus sp. K07]